MPNPLAPASAPAGAPALPAAPAHGDAAGRTAPGGGLARLGESLRRRPAALGGLVVFLAIVLVAIFAPLIAPHDPLKQNLGDNFKPPVWEAEGDGTYPFGTDPLGRDLLSRLIYGARYSLFVSVASVVLGSLLGFGIGLVAGFFGRWTDTVLMRLGDIQLAFPFVLFAIAVLAVAPERTVWHLILVLGVSSWVIYARVVRSRVLSEREKEYAWAARALGASRPRVLFRYVVPNVWQAVLPISLLNLAFFVIVESLLSFLALGLSPPTPSWGSILADGRQYMMVTPWMAIFPGVAIIITVLSISLTADGLAEYFDPKLGHGAYRRVPLKGAQGGKGARGAQDGGVLRSGSEGGSGGEALLRVRGLTTEFPGREGVVRAVNGVGFEVARGQVLGIVGESGSGKSTLGLSIIGLLDAPGRVTAGEVLFDGQDLARLDNRALAALRGARLGMIFQDPGASLNPVLTVGYQLRETIRARRGLPPAEASRVAREALAAVHVADPDRVLKAYPFQLSGGMQQRVMIALAMVGNPDLLILDEPTSALDVTTQAQLLDELAGLRARLGTSVIFITHDIALLAGFADVILVLYAGQVCEIGPRERIIEAPQHPYTRALLQAVERTGATETGRLAAIPGDPPDPTRLPPGCPFAPRCPLAMPVCREVNPAPIEVDAGHQAACHLLEPTTVRMDA